jgi:hypothetical protein
MCPHRNCTKINCGYAHSRKELISTGSFWKTEMCRFGAQCKIKQTCRFAHDQEELRTKKHNGQEISYDERQKMEEQMIAQRNSSDDFPRRRSDNINKTQNKNFKTIDTNLGKLINAIDEDNRETYCPSFDGDNGPILNMYSDELRSLDLDNSSYSDEMMIDQRMSALSVNHLIRGQCPQVNELWMSDVNNNSLFNHSTGISNDMIFNTNQFGLISSNGNPLFNNNNSFNNNIPTVLPPSSAFNHIPQTINPTMIGNCDNNNTNNMVSSTNNFPQMDRLWWSISEDDLVCAMPENYED